MLSPNPYLVSIASASVFQRSNGKWTAQLQVGVTPKGKRKFKTMTSDTKKEAEHLLNELKKVYSGLSTAELLEAPVSEAAEIWFCKLCTSYFFTSIIFIYQAQGK